jgi:hypothetical protein
VRRMVSSDQHAPDRLRSARIEGSSSQERSIGDLGFPSPHVAGQTLTMQAMSFDMQKGCGCQPGSGSDSAQVAARFGAPDLESVQRHVDAAEQRIGRRGQSPDHWANALAPRQPLAAAQPPRRRRLRWSSSPRADHPCVGHHAVGRARHRQVWFAVTAAPRPAEVAEGVRRIHRT